MSQNGAHPSAAQEALAVICGAGSLPFALAEAAKSRNRRVVLFALRGWADAKRVANYPHHWIWIGQFGRFMKLAAAEGCREVTFIGSVTRPSILSMRPDFLALRHLPEMFRMFRGGDDHLQGVVAKAFEQRGVRLVGPKDVAPELLVPHGLLGGRSPNARDRADIARGLALLRATSPFDIGQAVVIADNQVLALEGPEGTDQMLARVAELRGNGRIRSSSGSGVLVKAPKVGQDQRLDLPTIGPDTVEHAGSAGLAGIAVVAGSGIVAEPNRVTAAANKAGLFVIGVSDDGTEQ